MDTGTSRGAVDTYALNDGCSFSVAPGWGCNMFSWRVDGEELMFCPPDYPAAAWKITGGGTPLLFPAVGRTWDTSVDPPVQGRYRIHGSDREYHMPSHGILFLCDWQMLGDEKANDTLGVTYEAVIPENVREENYPFDVSYIQHYTLSAHTVTLEATACNLGKTPAPVAFGYHPYFRISNPQREGVQVRLPVTERLLLTPDTVLPTGEAEPTDGLLDLQPDVYYDLAFTKPMGRRMSLLDRRAGHAIHVGFDENFELFFAYAPDGAEFFCIEPWTRGLGAFERLKNPGWERGAFIPVLKAGETRHYRASFTLDRDV